MKINREESEDTHARSLIRQWNIEHRALMSLTMELNDIQYNPDIVGTLYEDDELIDNIRALEIMVDKRIALLKRKAERELKKLSKNTVK